MCISISVYVCTDLDKTVEKSRPDRLYEFPSRVELGTEKGTSF